MRRMAFRTALLAMVAIIHAARAAPSTTTSSLAKSTNAPGQASKTPSPSNNTPPPATSIKPSPAATPTPSPAAIISSPSPAATNSPSPAATNSPSLAATNSPSPAATNIPSPAAINSPGQFSNSPGQDQSSNAPGQSNAPGKTPNAPIEPEAPSQPPDAQAADGGPGQSSNAPGQSSGSPGQSSNAPGQVKKTLQGPLVIVTHELGETWALRNDEDGKVTPIAMGFKPPKDKDKNKNEKDFEPGTVVAMDCNIDGTGTCTPTVDTAPTIVAAVPDYSAYIYQRVLVMILDYSACGLVPGINVTTVRSLFLGPNGDGLGGIAQRYNQYSYGRLNLNTTAFQALVVPQSCSTAVTSSCSWWTISNGADTTAKGMLGTTAFAEFTHYIYVVPPGLNSVCPWAGLALLPGKQVWLQTSEYGVYRWATVMQEALHNYGLWHSWQNGYEYNDFSTAMGRGDACPNAAEISRLGWATPAYGGAAIDSSVLTQPGVSRSFSLPATYITGDGNYLRVLPDWLPTYSLDSSVAKNLYLAVRVPKASDALLGSQYANKLNMHEVNATMDNGYPTTYQFSDRKISFFKSITSLSMANLTNYQLSVYAGSWASTDTLRVHICRWIASPSECPSLSALEQRPGLPTAPPSP
ncbi:hypothetical protein Vretimale_14998, partial [Volvox reticuliferus]